jgi:hypothetical protein
METKHPAGIGPQAHDVAVAEDVAAAIAPYLPRMTGDTYLPHVLEQVATSAQTGAGPVPAVDIDDDAEIIVAENVGYSSSHARELEADRVATEAIVRENQATPGGLPGSLPAWQPPTVKP